MQNISRYRVYVDGRRPFSLLLISMCHQTDCAATNPPFSNLSLSTSAPVTLSGPTTAIVCECVRPSKEINTHLRVTLA